MKLPTKTKTPSTQLTPAQVCDLPMGDLLARVNGSLADACFDEPNFFGYVTIRPSTGHITVHTPASLADDTRDGAIRFLITQHLGLPAHLFPDCLEVTRFTIDVEGEQA